MRRREFIAGLGTASAWPLAARAQPAERVRRIGVLMGPEENDPFYKSILTTFTQALAGLGWTDGRNVWIDVRWAGSDINGMGDNDAEIEAAIVALGREPGGGLVIMPDDSCSLIARRSYWRRPETTYRRSIRNLSMPGTAACSPTDPTR